MSDYHTIVVPYDFSEHARAALDTAVDLARRLQSDIHLIHIVQPPSYTYAPYGTFGGATAVLPPANLEQIKEGARGSLREVAGNISNPPGKVEVHVLEAPSIVGAIQTLSEELGADLIVMGTHGRGGLAHVFLGSVAERTIRDAPCPVLTVRAPEESS